MSQFYHFNAPSLSGEAKSMSEYAGKLVLVVNTASRCGFTPQYAGLEKLYREFNHQGLVILGFPCNQFGKQEPGDAAQIEQTCYINYGVSFPMFAKLEVNGANAHPMFDWLKQELPGFPGRAIKWNFTKFLINKKGQALKRFAPFTAPEKLRDIIQRELNK